MILIVDDQKDTGTALERLLRYAGHESVSVTGGAEAIAMLHVRKPSLLVLDVNMPDMDGLTILRTIKEHDELKDVRVAMYSADTRPETMAKPSGWARWTFSSKARLDSTSSWTGFRSLRANRIGRIRA